MLRSEQYMKSLNTNYDCDLYCDLNFEKIRQFDLVLFLNRKNEHYFFSKPDKNNKKPIPQQTR